MNLKSTVVFSLMAIGIAHAASASEIIRHALPNNSSFPIAAAVEVPAGKTLVYLSGKVPPPLKAKTDSSGVASYGDTETQTIGVLGAIRDQLKGLGLGMGDIIRMQVFLVGDPAHSGRMDFAGFMKGYVQFFGTAEQPNLPARSTLQVAALADPGFLVEIEVTAARP
ncbi:MAG TPA: RidA family protein [Dokdonella sp.]|uniref:RidA family protein n=1 Tax=Dokdonella sp. TaxID=2291710 RepID=UPI002C72F276|nr:RidA family protein [Dokdonella sp.]HOX72915.1 RidA family protein [Dokdonella sp.]HPG94457.1 RidA family protein [Dokdonella sp.]HPN79141.1 RidA family protein [Dokdonella sp.]